MNFINIPERNTIFPSVKRACNNNIIIAMWLKIKAWVGNIEHYIYMRKTFIWFILWNIKILYTDL